MRTTLAITSPQCAEHSQHWHHIYNTFTSGQGRRMVQRQKGTNKNRKFKSNHFGGLRVLLLFHIHIHITTYIISLPVFKKLLFLLFFFTLLSLACYEEWNMCKQMQTGIYESFSHLLQASSLCCWAGRQYTNRVVVLKREDGWGGRSDGEQVKYIQHTHMHVRMFIECTQKLPVSNTIHTTILTLASKYRACPEFFFHSNITHSNREKVNMEWCYENCVFVSMSIDSLHNL